MYCKDCYFWGIEYTHHICNNLDKLHEADKTDKSNDSLIYPYTEGGYFMTGPMFGCVHFRGKIK